ncbi:ExbD/TolR family protein [Sulfuriroseicoccus oceanibius]|uniref:Biopolymer transporter ExbD n=1 Tax=Sulfuriroseicoccus oceanibius TaxID=2707525 RepID=A0A6B3L7D3_9BACT|nr:biopolymer transporter ExbD [Sulfuriroseicoccus oceanibius]QQL43944.1 biopolymer transporter ExbD [Sulfuriroseicoccus oceanibius]
MASQKLQASASNQLDDMQMDMSPMIDMVFLLLIFFMVASTMITQRKDPDVVVPIAPKGQDVKTAQGRITINVYSDAVMKKKGRNTPYADVNSVELTREGITRLVEKERLANEQVGTKSILYVRGDQAAIVQHVKTVIAAAAKGGVNDVIFSGYSRKVGQ